MDFPIQATITGTFGNDITQEELLDRLQQDEETLNSSMEAEIEFRINEVVQTLVPDSNVTIENRNSSVLEIVSNRNYKYTIYYILRVNTPIKITQQIYRSLIDELRSEFQETIRFANMDRTRSYTNAGYNHSEIPDGYIDIQLLDTLEATKSNIRGRTAKAVFSGLPKLPTKLITNIAGYVNVIHPESAPRSRPLAPELSNARLIEYNTRAVTRPPPPDPKKKAWWKFWGGRSRKGKTHKRHSRKSHNTRKARNAYAK
jgi:hypothetical protein